MATSLLEYKTLQKKEWKKRKKDIIGLNLVKHICRATDVSYKVNIERITNPNSCEQERICLSDKTQGRVVFSFCFFCFKVSYSHLGLQKNLYWMRIVTANMTIPWMDMAQRFLPTISQLSGFLKRSSPDKKISRRTQEKSR